MGLEYLHHLGIPRGDFEGVGCPPSTPNPSIGVMFSPHRTDLVVIGELRH